MAAVSVAGPASNVVIAVLVALLFQMGLLEASSFSLVDLRTLDLGAWVSNLGTYIVFLNLVLAAFNILPLPPLDGGGILAGIAPRRWLPAIAQLQKYGPIVLVALIGVTFLTDLSPLGFLLGPVVDLAGTLIGR